MSEAADRLRDLIGRPLASDLLELAQARNPDVEIWIQESVKSGPYHEGARVVTLVVKTGRGTMTFRRGPRERWSDVYRRAGLL